MKTIKCPAKQSTKIISNFGRGYAQTFRVKISTINGEEVTGKYIENHYFWIFPQLPKEGNLKSTMKFHRRWIDGVYSVSIIPNVDVVVEIQ